MTLRATRRYFQVWGCTAPDALFTDAWETACDPLTLATVERQHGLPCDGGGVPGPFCDRCQWGEYIEGGDEEAEP